MSPIYFRGDELLPFEQGCSWNNRYFLDTEFTDFEHQQLISLAIVGENGHEFYCERIDFDVALCTEFVQITVLPQLGQLGGHALGFEQMRKALHVWFAGVPVAGNPVLCYDHEVDIRLLHELLAGQLPDGWKLESVAAKLNNQRRAEYYARHGGEHHALYDARANAWAGFA